MGTTTDRIEKQVFLKAPKSRVWKAVSDAKEFGSWFGVDFDGPFVAGKPLRGRIAPTKVDPAVAESQKPHAGKPFDITVDRIEPEHTFSFRWHPYAVDPKVDYSTEPTTLVVFHLEDAPGGTRLTLTESGFDGIPIARRAEALSMNDGGWTAQMTLIEKYLAS